MHHLPTVEIAVAIRECQLDEAWLDDEDFVHARASGQVDVADFDRSYLAAWAHTRYGFAARYTFQMAQAGELRGVMSACAIAQALPSAEGQLRSLTKALSPTYLIKGGEKPDDDERDEASWSIGHDAISESMPRRGYVPARRARVPRPPVRLGTERPTPLRGVPPFVVGVEVGADGAGP